MKVREFFSIRKYAFLSALITAFFAFLIFYSSGLIGAEGIFLHDDLWAIYPAYIRYFWESIFGPEPFSYSFYAGMGSPMSIYMWANVLSPFHILVLFSQDDNLVFLIIVILKLLIASYCFVRFMNIVFHRKGIYPFILGISYALCSYSLIFYYNVIFLDSLYILPILLILLYRMIKEQKYFGMVWGLFYTFLLGFYQGYILGVILAFVSLVAGILEYRKSIKQILILLLKLLMVAVVATLMSVAVIGPAIWAIISNKSQNSSANVAFGLNLTEFIKGFTFWSHQNQDSMSPAAYSGIVVLILFLAFFVHKRIDKRWKVMLGSALLFLLLCSFSPAGYYFIHMFDLPSGSQYRFAFVFSLLFCIGATEFLCTEKLFSRKLYKFIVPMAILGECLWAGYNIENVQDRGDFETKEVYATWSTEVAELVNKQKAMDKGLYRFKYENALQVNDSMYFRFAGLSSFNTIQNEKIRTFNEKIGYATSERNLLDQGGTPLTQMLYAQKYTILNSKDAVLGDAQIVMNQFVLPIVYSCGDEIIELDLIGENAFDNQNAWISALTGENVSVFKKVELNDIKEENLNIVVNKVEGEYRFSLEDFTQNYGLISYTISSELPVYMQILQDENAVVIGVPEVFASAEFGEIIKTGIYTGAVRKMQSLDASEYRGNIAIYDEITPYGKYNDVLFYKYDEEELRKAYEKLTPGQLEHITYENGVIKGDIEISEEYQILMTSIPYDSGWRLKVDGVYTETYSVFGGTFLMANVTPGHHDIELSYCSARDVVMGIISIVSILGVVIVMVIEKRKKAL